MIDQVIHSAKTITPAGTKEAWVLIRNGVIVEVAERAPEGLDCTVVEVGDNILMAGIVDPHVHINEPGRTEWEGFDTATRAAVAGGVTTLVDMPLNSSPVTTTKQAFREKLDATNNKLHTNVGFWGGVIPGNEKEMEPLIAAGVLGFKAFLTHSGIDEFPNVTEADLRKVMPLIAKYGLPLLVHCELSTALSFGEGSGVRSYQTYLSSRPKQWEDNAIALMIRLCEEFNCRTHIVHLSSADSITQITRAKQKGLPLTVETAQHYLYFNAEDIPDGQCEYKCAPPIREKENNEKLWQALKDGIIDFVATDHSPAPPELKHLDTGNLAEAWGGLSSIQFALPALWTAAKKHGCTPDDVASWLCAHPARLVQGAISTNRKGAIEKGYDGDFVTWDPGKSFTVTSDIILHRHKTTPYLNETLSGVVQQTFLSGKQVYGQGKLLHLNEGKILLNDRR
ncbi:MAG: allB [Chitinophagaceae bacterium]|jgi:allantoinase|nr:allB [Chitinophagaceae bacterium]